MFCGGTIRTKSFERPELFRDDGRASLSRTMLIPATERASAPRAFGELLTVSSITVPENTPSISGSAFAVAVEVDVQFVQFVFPLGAFLLVVLEEFRHQFGGLLLAAATESLAADTLVVHLFRELVVVAR